MIILSPSILGEREVVMVCVRQAKRFLTAWTVFAYNKWEWEREWFLFYLLASVSFEKFRKIGVSKYAYSEDFIFEGIEEVEVLSYKVMRDKLREAVQLR